MTNDQGPMTNRWSATTHARRGRRLSLLGRRFTCCGLSRLGLLSLLVQLAHKFVATVQHQPNERRHSNKRGDTKDHDIGSCPVGHPWALRFSILGKMLFYPDNRIRRRSAEGISLPTNCHRRASRTKCPSSGPISFSIARRTAAGEPGIVSTIVFPQSPPIARLSIAAGPIS
jgi:hypothetical protein